MTRVRALSDGSSSFSTSVDGARVVVTSGKPGRERETVKELGDPRAALTWAEGQERSRLRKGFVQVAEDAAVGDPFFTVAVSNAYTGMLPVTCHEGELVTAFRVRDEDVVVTVDAEGGMWDVGRTSGLVAVLASTPSGLLALVDHAVFRLESGEFELLVERPTPVLGVLSVSGQRVLWHRAGRLELVDLAAGGTVLWSVAVQPEMYGGHTSVLCGAVSGDLVAWSDGRGRVSVADVSSGSQRVIDGFAMPSTLAFWGDHLVVQDQYAHALRAPALRVFDGEGLSVEWLTPPASYPHSLAVSPDGSRLAVGSDSWVTVHGLGEAEPLVRSRVDHVARRFGLAWLDDEHLGVRVDAGFVAGVRVG